MIENIKMPPANFHQRGELNLSREVDKSSKFTKNSSLILNKDETKALVNELNSKSEILNKDIKFSYNEKIGEVYVTITNKQTGEVIRQLPSKEAMKLKETMKEFIGSLFNKRI